MRAALVLLLSAAMLLAVTVPPVVRADELVSEVDDELEAELVAALDADDQADLDAEEEADADEEAAEEAEDEAEEEVDVDVDADADADAEAEAGADETQENSVMLSESSSAGVCQIVTASSVAALGSTAKVTPAVRNCPGLPCDGYLSQGSCLGLAGPIGSLGPLGALGPVGSNPWNPSAWISALGDITKYTASIAKNSANPLSAVGPLGAYNTLANSPNDFMKQLSAQGLWTVLGPLGPLGALGPLGPLGPNGVHGFARDGRTGAYTKGGAVQRTFDAAWDANSKRTWELVEFYPNVAAVNAVKDQDTSFIVTSTIAVGLMYVQTPDVISFTSKADQWVTVVAVPENTLDSFQVEVKKSGGGVLGSSTETFFVNWVQFHAAAGQKYDVSVILGISSRVSPIGFSYRLVVTGSSANLPATAFVAGPHIQKC